MLDRLYFDSDSEEKVLDFEKSIEKQGFYTSTNAEQRALRHAIISPRAVFDAGQLPEIVIRPPKDNAVKKIVEMIPNDKLRSSFYNTIDFSDEPEFFVDNRNYINRLWQLYNKSDRPNIRPISNKGDIINIGQNLGIIKGENSRAHYDPISHTMYVNPDRAANDIVAELAHAYQFRGTDTPRDLNWMLQFLSLPGDIKINGVDGYHRPGNLEYNAHMIIEPRFNTYLRSNHQSYDQLYNRIQRGYNIKPKTIKRGPKAGNMIHDTR